MNFNDRINQIEAAIELIQDGILAEEDADVTDGEYKVL